MKTLTDYNCSCLQRRMEEALLQDNHGKRLQTRDGQSTEKRTDSYSRVCLCWCRVSVAARVCGAVSRREYFNCVGREV